MTIFRLNDLPVELFHYFLDYFSTREIFYSFTNVSSYIDAVLKTYTKYRIDFQGIRRDDFDMICQRITSNQVIALTLSNDEYTPGLVGLFLSRFQIHQFTRLRALKLIDTEPEFSKTIITQMLLLKDVRSFCFLSSNGNDNDSTNHVALLAPLLPRLYQLRLCHGDFLDSIQFPHLRHLVLKQSSIELIKHISSAAPQLYSLETSFSLDHSDAELIYPLPRLNRLILQIHDSKISMAVLERMMSNLPRLKHLQLTACCLDDTIDGLRWRRKVKKLETFKFIFYVSPRMSLRSLDSFRTEFWLHTKRWFVAYTKGCFFSVPYFIPIQVDDDFRRPLYTTAPENDIFDAYVDNLRLTKLDSHFSCYFPHVHTLTLDVSLSVSLIKKIVNLGQVRRLELFSKKETFPIRSLVKKMSRLPEISIINGIDDFLNQIGNQKLGKIRILHLGHMGMRATDYKLKHLFNIFPNLEHLRIHHECSIKQIFRFLNGFQYLSTASFPCTEWSENLDNQPHAQKLSYTYQLDRSRIYFWLLTPSNH